MIPIHVIGVPLDSAHAGDPRRFAPPASAERLAALGFPVIQRRLHAPIPPKRRSSRTSARSTSATSPACAISASSPRLARRRADRRSSWAATTASPPAPSAHRRRGRETRSGCRIGLLLDRRARRHEHTRDLVERQRPRHAARGPARPRAVQLASIGGFVRASGRSNRHHWRTESRPTREGGGSRFTRARVHDGGHRSAGRRALSNRRSPLAGDGTAASMCHGTWTCAIR